MDTYADDLAHWSEKLDLKDAIHVGHSTGGGEVARYIGPTKSCPQAVLIGAVPPLMLKTQQSGGLRWMHSTKFVQRYHRSRAVFQDLSAPFYGVNNRRQVCKACGISFWLQEC